MPPTPPHVIALASAVTSGTHRARALHAVADRAERVADGAAAARSGVELAPHVADLARLLAEGARATATHEQLLGVVARVSWWTRLRRAWAALVG